MKVTLDTLLTCYECYKRKDYTEPGDYAEISLRLVLGIKESRISDIEIPRL